MYILFTKKGARIDTTVKNNVIDFDLDIPPTTIRFVDGEIGGVALNLITVEELRAYLKSKADETK